MDAYRITKVALAGCALVALALTSARGLEQGQDLTFRLLNIERRLDQLQQRVDSVERAQLNQSLGPPGRAAGPSIETVLEMQRQQLVTAEQVTLVQRQLLELRKQVDQLAAASAEPAKREPPPAEERKPKPPSRRP